MRKVWVVPLLLALIMALALPVSAADVKFSGSYVAQGYYDNNRTLLKDGGASVSDVWQRLRVQTDFVVQDGLMLTTRFDALEKIWGAPRSTTATSTSLAGNDDESENIKFTHAFVTLNVPGGFGTLMVGYMTQGTWGTAFGNTGEQDYGMRVKWDWDTGSYFWGARWDKVEGKKGYSSLGPSGNIGVSTYVVDHDSERYSVLGGYKWKTGDAGLYITYYLDTSTADNPTTGYKAKYWNFQPYARAQFGPVYFETEFGFYTGRFKDTNTGAGGPNVDYTGWRGYIMANVDLAPVYVGALAFYSSGNDLGTSDKNEGGNKIGTDFQPCLILFNYDLGRWNGVLGAPSQNGANAFSTYNTDNVMAFQTFAGIKPIPKLDLKVSFIGAQADTDGATSNWQSKSIGSELDLTATYKIYDNLSYMVGFGYLWAGNWFKGTNAAAGVDNDYLLTHKMTLNF
ncbi:MAG: hypothetical protein ACXWMW_12880 [Syntrophales bacterium]